MTYEEIRIFVNNLGIGRKKLGIYIENHYPGVYKEILEHTRFLDDINPKHMKITFAERMYCIYNDITTRCTCNECGSPVYFRTDTQRYRLYCSTRCSRSSKETKRKREETTFARYGDKHYNNIERSRETRMSKNGGKWHPDGFMEKVKEIKKKRYGYAFWSNEEQRRKTCVEKYGVEYPLMLKDVQNRCRESFAMKHPGMKSTMDIPDVRKKVHHGVRLRSWNFVLNNTLVEPLFTREEYLNCDDPTKTVFKFRCRKCGTEYESTWDNGTADLCPKCHPGLKGTSEAEMEIYNFLKENVKEGWSVHNKEKINRRIVSPKEIDIVVCDGNGDIRLLVEYDGLFFHSDSRESKSDHDYHLKKTEECERKGYRLIHVFENEWLMKKNIVKAMLLDAIGVYQKTISSGECEVRIVDNLEKDEFLGQNDIQGTCRSVVNYGLYHGEELVSMMAFGKTRGSNRNGYELLRFCKKNGYRIEGGAIMLMRKFEKDTGPMFVIANADRRWFVGETYRDLGFELDHVTRPTYWYFKPHSPHRLFNRMRFEKYRLKDILKVFDKSLTEVENMRNNGYDRIFDCGNFVFVKRY